MNVKAEVEKPSNRTAKILNNPNRLPVKTSNARQAPDRQALHSTPV